MLEQMIRGVIEKQLAEKYPQIQLPATLKARVTKASETGETYSLEFKMRLKIGGTDEDYIYTGKLFEYNIKILTRDGAIDEKFPEIPGIRSKIQVNAGDIVAVALCYGELDPYILGGVD